MYEITYLGAPSHPVTCQVAAGDVAGVIEQAGRDGARVLVRPCAAPHSEQQSATGANGGQDS
ncbi:hypothetical protein [Streptomyces bambusae]|uniref:Uncharacterized protein n=1 Tax=Streptomyces bambusae TaxID=1550616 RepID=A0ABS6Z004_9ACTN|nr:hypothetical protein [Streptomyces bambusae]MBW5481073.1 hypothetical protein [Streptomyces bambusae]